MEERPFEGRVMGPSNINRPLGPVFRFGRPCSTPQQRRWEQFLRLRRLPHAPLLIFLDVNPNEAAPPSAVFRGWEPMQPSQGGWPRRLILPA